MSFVIAGSANPMNNAIVHFSPQAIMQTIFESMYVSEFAGDADPAEIAKIVRVSRANNLIAGLTGVLMFDGSHFCQQLEGAEDAVRHTMAKIATDPRHTHFQPLHEGSIGLARRFHVWQVGILAPDGPSPLLLCTMLRGHAAVEHLMSVYRDSKQFGLHVV